MFLTLFDSGIFYGNVLLFAVPLMLAVLALSSKKKLWKRTFWWAGFVWTAALVVLSCFSDQTLKEYLIFGFWVRFVALFAIIYFVCVPALVLPISCFTKVHK